MNWTSTLVCGPLRFISIEKKDKKFEQMSVTKKNLVDFWEKNMSLNIQEDSIVSCHRIGPIISSKTDEDENAPALPNSLETFYQSIYARFSHRETIDMILQKKKC